MALPYSFSNNSSPTGPEVDADLAQLGSQSTVPCTVSGTNALTLTQRINTSTVTAYANNNRYSGVATATNTAATTARVGALAALNVYRDSPAGPVPLTGGEIVNGCAFTLVYDSALNTGAGGFHLFSTTSSFAFSGGTITGSIFLTDGASFTSTLTPALLSAASINATSLFGTTLAAGSGSITNATLVNASATTLKIGASAASITRMLAATGTLSYTVVPANSGQTQALLVPGCQANDVVTVGPPVSYPTGIAFNGAVSAAGTVGITALNVTNASIAAFSVVMQSIVMGTT